ncbi:MAG TPA: Crp/Fnr family transcriptional regulator [Terriglobales bacterium]|nr:Crp/Fnr family transcriptional regulator [Terriglobales bacterium]
MPAAADRLAQLHRLPLFAPLDDAALAALARRAAPRAYAAGDILFHAGDACAGVHLLTAGAVRIFKLSAAGRELTLHIQAAPATVAEVPLVDGGPYPASVSAVGEVSALFLRREDFLAVCLEHPQVALAALRVFGQRLRGLVELLEAVTFGGVRQRLARLLLEQAQRSRQQGEPGDVLQVGSQQQLALELGTVREVVSRNLNRFQAEGLIRIHSRALEVLDPDGLRREAEAEL